MFDNRDLLDRLYDIQEALERVPHRFQAIHTPDDFYKDENNHEHLDSICMVLVAVGEAFKHLDARTNGNWLSQYPDIPWSGVIGVRNVIAHGYFDIDAEQVFAICKDDIPQLIKTVRKMIVDVQNTMDH